MLGLNNNTVQIDERGFFYPNKYNDVLPSGLWEFASGGAAPDVVTVTIGGIAMNYRGFDGGSTEESMSNYFELLHDIDFDVLNAETIIPDIHVHGMPSTTASGVVKIFFDLIYFPLNGAPISWGTFSTLITVGASQQYYHKLGYVALTKPSSGYNIGDMVSVRVRRTPTDAQDTYAGDFLFMQCAIHMPKDGVGSRMIYEK